MAERMPLPIYLLHDTEIVLRRTIPEFDKWRERLPDIIDRSVFLTRMYLCDYRSVPIERTGFDLLVRVGPIDGANRREKAFMGILVVPAIENKISIPFRILSRLVASKELFPLSKFRPMV